jgi:hypothetical protein
MNFEVTCKADSEFAKCPMTRKSVGGHIVFLNGTPVMETSKMQAIVALSVTESEYIQGSGCVQDMLNVKRTLESVGLKVKLPMILEMDNSGAIDLSNNMNTSGRTRHIDVRHYFLRDLKEAGILKVKWISSDDNTADLFTKNLMGPVFERHAVVFCGHDEYMFNESEGESVGGDVLSGNSGANLGSDSDPLNASGQDSGGLYKAKTEIFSGS